MIEKKELEKIAALAHLELDGKELERLCSDMEDIIAFADEINSAPQKEADLVHEPVGLCTLRDDKCGKSCERESLLENAESRDGMFYVRGGLG